MKTNVKEEDLCSGETFSRDSLEKPQCMFLAWNVTALERSNLNLMY